MYNWCNILQSIFHHFSMFKFGFWSCWSSTSHQIRPRYPIVGGTTVPVAGRLSCKSSLNNEGLPKRNFGIWESNEHRIWESKATIQAPSEAAKTSRITIAFHTSSCSKAFSLALFPQVFFRRPTSSKVVPKCGGLITHSLNLAWSPIVPTYFWQAPSGWQITTVKSCLIMF